MQVVRNPSHALVASRPSSNTVLARKRLARERDTERAQRPTKRQTLTDRLACGFAMLGND